MQGGKNFICTAAAKTVSKTFNRKKISKSNLCSAANISLHLTKQKRKEVRGKRFHFGFYRNFDEKSPCRVNT